MIKNVLGSFLTLRKDDQFLTSAAKVFKINAP